VADAQPGRLTREHPVNQHAHKRVEQDAAPVVPLRRRLTRRQRWVMAAAAALAVLGGAATWLHLRHFEETDDAQVDGDISNLSPRVAGTIKAVYVVDHQWVRAGDLLAELDPADLEVAVAQARAAVAQATARLQEEDPIVSITETSNRAALASTASDLTSAQAVAAEARKTVGQLTAQLAQARAQDRMAQAERRRAELLVAAGAIARAEADLRISAAEAAAANTRALQHALAAARDRVDAHGAAVAIARSKVTEVQENAPRQVEARRASVLGRQAALDLAKAQLAQAELNLGYAKIRAPASGVVGKKSISVGDRVAPGQQILAIAQVQSLWVTANFRETQLAQLGAGQGARVHVDATGVELLGVVESVGGATGARLSVLPPENATGNFVKVVQRIPVRIRLQGELGRLRPGMSVEARVRVR
jgi:membrane fusion protein (multidrug efflux system)